METIQKRKSVRSYLPKEVEAEKVKAIVEVGNMAARAGKVYFLVITNAEVLKTIGESALTVMKNSGNDFLVKRAETPGFIPTHNAPVVAIVVSTETNDNPQTATMNVANVGCAGQKMLIAATSLGLGSCSLPPPHWHS